MMLAGKMSLYGELSCSEIQSVYEELGLARPARRDEGTQAGQITPMPGPGEPPERGVATLLQILCPSRKFMFDSKSFTEMSSTPEEEDILNPKGDVKLKFGTSELTKRHSMSSNETSFSFKTPSARKKIFSPECSPSSENVDKKCVTFARNPKSECSFKNIERRAKKIKRALSYSKSSHFENSLLKRDTYGDKSELGVEDSEEIGSPGISSTGTTETKESLDETKYTSPSTQSELVSSDPSINVMDPSMNVLDNMRRLKEDNLEEDIPTRESAMSESNVGEQDSSELDQETRAMNPSSWRSTLDTESALTITGDLLGDLRKEMLDPAKVQVALHSSPLIKLKKSKKSKRNADVVDKGSNTDCYFPFWHEPSSHKQRKERLEYSLKGFEKTLTASKKDVQGGKRGDVKSGDELYETCGESEESDLSMKPNNNNNNQTMNNRQHVETLCQNNVVSKFEWSKTPFLAYDTEGSSLLVSDTTCSDTNSRESTKHAQVQCTCTCETQVDLQPFNIFTEGGNAKKLRKNKFLTNNRVIRGDSSLSSRQTLSNCCSDTLLYNKSNMKTYHEVVTFPKVGDEKRTPVGKPKIFWAITKINIYPDDSRTYEVMPLTGKKPSDVPDKSDSVFVLIPPKHKQFCAQPTNPKF